MPKIKQHIRLSVARSLSLSLPACLVSASHALMISLSQSSGDRGLLCNGTVLMERETVSGKATVYVEKIIQDELEEEEDVEEKSIPENV